MKSKELDILLQPKQYQLLEFLEATGDHIPRRLGYGGARGGGKSGALRRIAMILASSHPGIVIVIIRRHYGDLVENHVEKMAIEYPDFHERFYRKSESEWRLDNKSRITLAYGDTARDVQEFSRGPEFTFLFVDQAEQFSEQELIWLTIPNRWPNAAKGFAKSAFFFNPGGPGTEFLRRVFFKREFKKDEVPEEWHFIQAYGWDNYEWFRNEVDLSFDEFYEHSSEDRFDLYVTKTSEGRKMNALPPALRVGELLGSFEHFSGQYYASVWDENTCILPMDQAEALIQPWWRAWCSQDWGFAHHNCNLWFASGKLSPAQALGIGVTTEWPIDVVVVYRELVVNEMGEEDLAREILRLTPQHERKAITAYWLGPDAWSKRGSAHTVADQIGAILEAGGMPEPERADNMRTSQGEDRIGGWRLLYNCFQRNAWRSGVQVEREAAQSGPMLLISAACPAVISAIPLAIRDEDNLEDVLKQDTVGDNCLDSLRYGCKSQLDAKQQAPKNVRAQLIADSIQDPTSRHLALLRFRAEEDKRSRPTRGASWRS